MSEQVGRKVMIEAMVYGDTIVIKANGAVPVSALVRKTKDVSIKMASVADVEKIISSGGRPSRPAAPKPPARTQKPQRAAAKEVKNPDADPTPSQTNLVMVLAEERGFDHDEISQEITGKPLGSLNRGEVSRVIDHLKTMPKA